MKVWIATIVDRSETSTGKARVLDVFKSEAEAREFVRVDIEEFADNHAGEDVEVDFCKLNARCESCNCEWNVEEVDIPESFMWCGNEDEKREDEISPKLHYVEIMLNGPEYRGASYPPFNEKAVNESEFEDALRCKSCLMEIKDNVGYVEWIAQEDDNASDAWKREIKRAFKANGLEVGSIIHVKFGSRDDGMIHQFTIINHDLKLGRTTT